MREIREGKPPQKSERSEKEKSLKGLGFWLRREKERKLRQGF